MPITFRRSCTFALLGLSPFLSGCLSHTHSVQLVKPPDVVMNATVDQIVQKINAQSEALQTVNVSVQIVASTGGGRTGKVKEYTSFRGYIYMRKPSDLRVLMLVPVVGTRALDMVSDGKLFTLLIPSQNKAMVGTDKVVKPSQNPLYNLRPGVFLDALVVKGILPDEFVTLTESMRILEPETRKREAIEEPDYDISVLGQKNDHVLERRRTVHISRVTLQPYQQDIYDGEGRIVTRVDYANYEKKGETLFPGIITITRPLDEYSLKITVTKLGLNQKFEEDQFELKIPDGYTIQKMD